MWHWTKNIEASLENEWLERTSSISNCVLSQDAKGTSINIDIYWEEESEALLYQLCWGGRIEKEEATDWVAKTAPENQAPLIIRQKIVISPSAKEDILLALQKKYPKRIILTFPAEMAFGTGDHATTSSCLRLLCDYAKKREPESWTLTDIGCGTGVLALAGIRLGAKHAISFDFDENAVQIAERNIERNGGQDKIELFQADVFEWSPKEGEKADLVLANLFATVLQSAFPRIVQCIKPGGSLIISGILKQQAEETIQAALREGLLVDKTVTRGKWFTAKLTLPRS